MLQLGFVSAILPEYDLEQVLTTAARIGYDCVEVMCWPAPERGVEERRYAGVRHLKLDSLVVAEVQELQRSTGVGISSLGYYPNVLDPTGAERAIAHLRRLMEAAADLGIGRVTTFVGRDKGRTIEAQWDDMLRVWRPLLDLAGQLGVRVGIENCPMRFTADEWPGGNNLALSPAVWERLWQDLPDAHWGLNYDPSHLVLQHMDPYRPLRDYPERLVHVHAKDLRIDREALDRHGVFAHPKLWHTPKLPGLGDVDWQRFFGYLVESGYRSAVCVEVEDRAYESKLDDRLTALTMSHDYLRQFIPRQRV